MLRRAFFLLLAAGLVGVLASAAPGPFYSLRAVAQTTPEPFSCFFAAFNQFNNLFNSGIACATPGAGGGGTTIVQPSPPITVTQVTSSPLTYQIGISIGTCLGVSAGSLVYTCATPSAAPTPSPMASSTGCGTLSWSGSWPYTINGNFSSCGGGSAVVVTGSPPIVITTPTAGTYQVTCPTCTTSIGATLYTPVPIPTNAGSVAVPQNGYLSVGGINIGPTGTPSPWPQGIVRSTSVGTCSSFGRSGSVSWGTDGTSNVIGTSTFGLLMRVGCDQVFGGGDAGTALTLDPSGNLAVAGGVYSGASGDFVVQGANGVLFPTSAVGVFPCRLRNYAGSGVMLTNTGSGTCTFLLPDVTSSSPLCTDTSGHFNALIAAPSTCGVHAFHVAATTASSCTAFVSCGTVNFSFPNAYGAAPYCSAAGVQDTTTALQHWNTEIDAVAIGSITYSYAPLVTTAGAHSLLLTFTCGTS